MGISLRGGKGENVYQPLAEINVTPLVDVMLVLLIIFMITAPLLTAGVKVNLPKAASAQPLNPKEPLVVTIDKDGRMSLGGSEMGLDGLVEAVRVAAGDDPTRIVHIRGDKDAAFGQVVTIMDRLTGIGVAHIAIVTAGKPAAPIAAPPP